MMKRKLVLTVAALLAAIPSLSQNSTLSMGRNPKTCADVQMSFDNRATVRAEQSLSFPLSEAPTLTLNSDENSGVHNGGIQVTGADGTDYAVTVCKAAAGKTEAEAQQVMSQVQVQRTGGTLSITGPERDGDQQWNVMILVSAPRTARLDLSTHNGPVSVADMAGGGEVRAHNGPVRLKNSTGDFTVETHNGPISFSGNGGNVKLNAKNGPISVDVAGEDFAGELTGEAENGPIELMLPSKFSSGIEVGNDNAPISCDADLCRAGIQMDGHRIKFGSSNAVIRLSTEHGPVSVQNRKKL